MLLYKISIKCTPTNGRVELNTYNTAYQKRIITKSALITGCCDQSQFYEAFKMLVILTPAAYKSA